MWLITFLGMFSGFSFEFVISLEKGLCLIKSAEFPASDHAHRITLTKRLLKRHVTTSAQKLSGLTIYTGIRALTTTGRRINTKN